MCVCVCLVEYSCLCVFLHTLSLSLSRSLSSPDDTDYLKLTVESGDFVDYFKPKEGKSFCAMLVSSTSHLWSPNPEEKEFVALATQTTVR